MPSFLLSVAFLTIAGFIALASHEVGHAVGGSLRGLRLSLLIVGPVHIQRGTGGRLRLRLNRKLSYAGGVTASVPRSTEGLRRAMLHFAAGGPVASIVVGVLLLAIYMMSDLPAAALAMHEPIRNALALGMSVLAVLSLGIGLLTLLPVSQGAFVNDGKRILRLLRPGAAADGYAAVMALGGYLIAGVRPRDWDPELVALAISLADGSHEDLAGRHMAHEHALDRGNVQAAGEHIRYMVDHAAGAPVAYRTVILVDAAYFEAAYGGDAASARSRLAEAGKNPFQALDPTAPLRAEGAVLLAAGDTEGASAKLYEAYASLASGRDGSSEFSMAEIRRLCRARGLPNPGGAVAESLSESPLPPG